MIRSDAAGGQIPALYGLALMLGFSWNAARFLVPLYITDVLAGSPAVVGLAVGVAGIVPLAVGAHLGHLSDRHGPTAMLRLTVIVLALGALILCTSPGIALVVVGCIVLRGGHVATLLSAQAYIALLTLKRKTERYFAHLTLWEVAGMMLGPVLAGFLIDHWGYRAGFVAVLIGVLVVMRVSWGLGRAPVALTGPPQSVRAGSIEAAWSLLKVPRLIALLGVIFCLNFAFATTVTFLPLHLAGAGMSATFIGMVLSVNGLASMAARPAVNGAVRWLGYRVAFLVSMLIAGVSLCLIRLATADWGFVVLSAAVGLGIGLCQPLTISLMVSLANERYGLGLGVRMSVQQMGQMLGPAALGLVATAIGTGYVFPLAGAVLAAGAVTAMARLPSEA